MLGAALVPFCENRTALEGSEIAAGNVGDRMFEVRRDCFDRALRGRWGRDSQAGGDGHVNFGGEFFWHTEAGPLLSKAMPSSPGATRCLVRSQHQGC
jgi:hypothetical protein